MRRIFAAAMAPSTSTVGQTPSLPANAVTTDSPSGDEF
jgi:hypothetical protein